MIDIGSKVKLNVGGPNMVVDYINDNRQALCRWFVGPDVKSHYFDPRSLAELDTPRTATDEIDDEWISDQVSHALKEAEEESTVTTLDRAKTCMFVVRRAEELASEYVRERYSGVPDDELTMAVLREMAEQLLEDNAHLLRQASEGVAQAQSALHGGDLGDTEPPSNPMHAFGMGRGD